nr:MAG TPA: Protein of unknown function (DUF669) [Bacteriophage sp.]
MENKNVNAVTAFSQFGVAHADNDPTPHGVTTFDVGDEIDVSGLPAFGARAEIKPLPEGMYNFTVADMTAEDYEPKTENGKIPPCTKLNVKLHITDKDGVKHPVFDRLYLCGLDWSIRKIRDFFASIGVTSDNGKLKITMDVGGRTGRAKIEIHEYNGKKSNRVAYYTAPEKPDGLVAGKNDLPF